MESEEVSAGCKENERQPPRNLPILRQIRDLYSRYTRQERKQKKAETDHQRNERMMAQWTARVGYFTFFFVVFSAAGNWIIYGQLKEMRSSGEDTKALVKAAQDSAKAAQDAVEVAKDTAQRQLRAYVFLDKIIVVLKETKILLSVSFKNTGQTPAYNFFADTHLFFGQEGGVITKLYPDDEEKWNSEVMLGSNVPATQTREMDVSGYVDIIKNPLNSLVVHGTIKYRDVFGQSHYCTFKTRRVQVSSDTWAMEVAPEGNKCD